MWYIKRQRYIFLQYANVPYGLNIHKRTPRRQQWTEVPGKNPALLIL
jgi:hypothetical protein